MSRVALARNGLYVAGVMLAVESLMGCFATLGIFWEAGPVLYILALTLGFPVYLLSLRSFRAAAVGLWVLLIYRLILLGREATPSRLRYLLDSLNPLASGWMPLLPMATILVTASLWALSRPDISVGNWTLRDVLRSQTPAKPH